jgi:hypothetical protein
MSTTNLTTWATDLADVGPIYPFPGTEMLLLILGLATWIGWHLWCIRWEKKYHRERIEKYGDSKALREALEAAD